MRLLFGILLFVLAPSDSLDIEVTEFMSHWKLKGVQIASACDGGEVFERSYGWADEEQGIRMDGSHIMRIASVSKLVTAAGIMKLRDEGKLQLDDRLFGEGGILNEYDSIIRDRRYNLITIENLLRHEGGFSQKGGDPMFENRCGLNNEELLHRELSRRLAFCPGTAMEYSNLGFLLLSMAIEKITGEDYESWTKRNILEPAGISDMKFTSALPEERLPNESLQYTDHGFDRESCYESRDIQGLSGGGAWAASASDLCRLALAIDGKDKTKDVLSRDAVFEMTCWFDKPSYSLGWNDTDPTTGWTRTGTLYGTSALLWYFPDGQCWALISNTSSWRGSKFSKFTKALLQKIHGKYITLQTNKTDIQ